MTHCRQLLGVITASPEMRAMFKDDVLLNSCGSAVIDLGDAAADDDGGGGGDDDGGGGGGDGDGDDTISCGADDDTAGDADSLRTLCLTHTELLLRQAEEDTDDAGVMCLRTKIITENLNNNPQTPHKPTPGP